MQNKKRETYITIIDNNITNQKALSLMIYSLQVTNSQILDELYIICPYYLSDDSFIQELKEKDFHLVFFNYAPVDDPYYIKFLISEFILIFHDKTDVVTYIDPDHIFLKKIENDFFPIPNDNEVIMSSESNELSNEYFSHYVHSLSNMDFINYNSSFVRARTETWYNIVSDWEKNYHILTSQVSSRFCEEIAFSLTLKEHDINVIQISPIVQSNFKVYDKNCFMFHYGGEYRSAHYVKSLVRNFDNIYNIYTYIIEIIQKMLENGNN